MKLIAYDNWNEDEVIYQSEISDEEFLILYNLTPDKLYHHMEQCIGQMTPQGESKFIPAYTNGKLKISMQISYYLWSKRGATFDNLNNEPINSQEFFEIVGGNPDNTRFIDVKAWWDGNVILQATQATLSELCTILYLMTTN